MNAFELYTKEGKRAGVWACGQCRIVRLTEDLAAQCCEPKVCGQCGTARPDNYLYCPPCRSLHDAKRDAERWDVARKLPSVEYGGTVWHDDSGTWHGNSGDFLDSWEQDHEEGDPLTSRVYAAKPFPMSFDAAAIIEHALEDHHEDAYEEVGAEGFNELQQYLDGWIKRWGITSYEPDYSTAIVFDDRKLDES